MRKQIELLSPAGTYETFEAAIAAGADAVYLGGSRFGARAYAGNFSEPELLRAIDTAHIHQKKIYLTVNTLFKEEELTEQLERYLKPYYEAGLDGVIVQDLGVLAEIRRLFPNLPLHASTQMSVTGAYGARWLKNQGVSRVVCARELTLEEIREIYDATGMEIECFVHGALCYCYSGQCLLSSMLGGRSGNRGRCAQPCRLPYEADGRSGHFLSPKDMAAVKILPRLADSGICSLKIEGRMKSREYTAGVVSIYRKYVDLYLEKGEAGYQVDEKDILELMDLYNRGGFHHGYYLGQTGPAMMSTKQPNHMGTPALSAAAVQEGRVTFKALLPVWRGDVFQIAQDFNITAGQDRIPGETFTVQIPARFVPQKGETVYRIKCASLLEKIQKKYCTGEQILKEPIAGALSVRPDMDISLTLWTLAGEEPVYAQVSGGKAEAAQKRPVTEENLRKQVGKLKDTPFVLTELEIDMPQEAFIPLQEINELRRKAVEALQKAILRPYVRVFEPGGRPVLKEGSKSPCPKGERSKISLGVQTTEQLEMGLAWEGADRIYVDYALFYEEAGRNLIGKARGKKEIYGALPRIVRQNKEKELENLLAVMKDTGVSGYLVRNLETAAYLKAVGSRLSMTADYGLYAWNKSAVGMLQDLFGMLTAPLELSQRELKKLPLHQMELLVYGYFPVMLSAQCIKKTLGKCDTKENFCTIKDRKQAAYRVESRCRFCHSIMYYHKPLYLGKLSEDMEAAYYRYEFTSETPRKMRDILERGPSVSTCGHFVQGVE